MRCIRFLTAGESHGSALMTIVEGIPAGLALTEDDIARDLGRRQVGYGRGGRMAIEKDRAEIIGGVVRGATSGAPIALLIKNKDWENWREREWPELHVPRPGHADLVGMLKYELPDCRPVLERASARETAARVAAGAVARKLLESAAVEIGSYVERIGSVAMVEREPDWQMTLAADANDVRCPEDSTAGEMRREIDSARQAGESLGGILVVLARNLPPGLGSYVHWDRRLDGRLAQAILSIQAIKGVEFGAAFANAALKGTEVHDPIHPLENPKDMKVGEAGRMRLSNRAGGLEGGVTTGQLLVIRAAMKPIPTTLTSQPSVNLQSGERTEIEYQRSDVCAVPAAAVVAEAMVCLVLADALLEKFGGDSITSLLASMERYLQVPVLRIPRI